MVRNKLHYCLQCKVPEEPFRISKKITSTDLQIQLDPATTVNVFVSCSSGVRGNGRDKTKFDLWIISETDIKCSANFVIHSEVENQMISCRKTHLFSKETQYSTVYSLSKDMLLDPNNGFFRDGWMTIYLDVYFFCNTSAPLGMRLYDDEVFTDFALLAEGKEIKIHKCVFASVSKFFHDMFEHAVGDSVVICPFDFETVHAAKKFIYGFDLSEELNLDLAMNLYSFLHKFQINDYMVCYFVQLLLVYCILDKT